MKSFGITTLFWTCGLFAAAACSQSDRTRFVHEHEWAATGTWLRADTHMHSRLSDGGHEVGPLIDKAKEHGCQIVAVTEHADRQLKGAGPEYMAALALARVAHPDLVILGGLEWNVPPYGGREHATVLVPHDPSEGALLAEFRQRFDDYDRSDQVKPTAEAGLDWLAEITRDLPIKPVVIYNHPSRKDTSSLSNVDDVVRWRSVNDVVIGFEGAPGHQGLAPLGSYSDKEPVIDRWDPVVARPGDAWDTLLQRGIDVHGAIAGSDFHTELPNDLNDFWPCQFAETFYFVPEPTPSGVIRAMRAGTFFGSHGKIVRNLELTVLAEGLSRPAMVGEAIRVPIGSEVTAALAFDVPPTDWQQQPNKIDAVEFIVITPDRVETRVHQQPAGGPVIAAERLTIGKEGAVVRARVRRVVPDGPDLMAYTNAIRIHGQ